MAWYLVEIKKDGVLTNVIVKADSPEKAEKKAHRCASH